MMPNDLPPWKTVYHYFRLWTKDGTLDKLHPALRAEVRKKAGRKPMPSVAAEAMIYFAMCRVMIRRLAHSWGFSDRLLQLVGRSSEATLC
jgi:transposase